MRSSVRPGGAWSMRQEPQRLTVTTVGKSSTCLFGSSLPNLLKTSVSFDSLNNLLTTLMTAVNTTARYQFDNACLDDLSAAQHAALKIHKRYI